MKKETLIFVLFSLGLVSFMSNKATITIPANQEFVLGEQENHAFKAKLSNLSGSEVTVAVVNKRTLEETQGFGLPGRQRVTIQISKTEKVLLKNPHKKAVKVRANLNKGVSGMRYQAINSSRRIMD